MFSMNVEIYFFRDVNEMFFVFHDYNKLNYVYLTILHIN